MAIGEAGTLSTNYRAGSTITVDFTEPLTNPVITMTGTSVGGHTFALRVVDQTLNGDGDTTSFSFIIEEWEYLDERHPNIEDIYWLAVEEGTHILSDGRIIEAGTVSANHTDSSVSLNGAFPAPPVVLTTVASNNDPITVDSDPSNITTSGFNVRLQEEQAQDNVHANETVGWIAIQPGGDGSAGTASTQGGVDEVTDIIGLGATYTDPIVLADTQTLNDTDPAVVSVEGLTSTTVGILLDEEESADTEVDHAEETVGVVVFENGIITCFCEGTMIETPLGPKPVESLHQGDLLSLYNRSQDAPLLRVFKRHLRADELTADPKLRPVRITAGALNGQLPRRDLLVSRQHRMLINSTIALRMFGSPEVLVPAIKLTELPGIYVDDTVEDVTYYHLLLDTHDVIFAEGAPTESLYLGVQTLHALSNEAREEIHAIFPETQCAGYIPDQARFIPAGPMQKRLISRHLKNCKPILAE